MYASFDAFPESSIPIYIRHTRGKKTPNWKYDLVRKKNFEQVIIIFSCISSSIVGFDTQQLSLISVTSPCDGKIISQITTVSSITSVEIRIFKVYGRFFCFRELNR